MPFKNLDQSKACFAKKSHGAAKGWDCKEWADKTDYSHLPEKKAALAKLAFEAATITHIQNRNAYEKRAMPNGPAAFAEPHMPNGPSAFAPESHMPNGPDAFAPKPHVPPPVAGPVHEAAGTGTVRPQPEGGWPGTGTVMAPPAEGWAGEPSPAASTAAPSWLSRNGKTLGMAAGGAGLGLGAGAPIYHLMHQHDDEREKRGGIPVHDHSRSVLRGVRADPGNMRSGISPTKVSNALHQGLGNIPGRDSVPTNYSSTISTSKMPASALSPAPVKAPAQVTPRISPVKAAFEALKYANHMGGGMGASSTPTVGPQSFTGGVGAGMDFMKSNVGF